ncbi:MAG: peptidase dimerization domain-containing protein, partial [Patescibacteria group bacterium]|nr:peptidase dimerization domain-containing protein [Patescibacteria group bacterium]
LGTIITASPFYERFDLVLIGKEAHASLPNKAKNILFPLKEILNKQKLGKIDAYTLFNIGVINGGYVRNTIPGELHLKGEIRSFLEKNLIKEKNKFLNILEKIEKKYSIKIKKDFVRENPGYFHNDKKIINKIKNIIKKTGLKPALKQAWGVSDANIFNDKKNLLCFNLADATEFSHSKEERIKIKNLIKLKEIIETIINNF